MSDTGQSQSGFPSAQWVPAGEDRFGEYRLGISRIDFKLSAQDSDGNWILGEPFLAVAAAPPGTSHYEQEEAYAVKA